MRITKFMLVAMFLMAALISAINCGGKTENTQLQTYSGHGFSFKYSKTFRVTNETIANGNFLVAVSRIDLVTSEFQSFMVVYGQGRPYGETLDWNQCQYYLDSAKQGNTKEYEEEYLWSPVFETTHSGHSVMYKCYTETLYGEYGTSVVDHGVTAIFFCDKSDRTFVLHTFNSDNVIHNWVEAWEDFTIYLDSFECH
jgi:hypothetical protein